MYNKVTNTRRGVYSTAVTQLRRGIRVETILIPRPNSGEPDQCISVRVIDIDQMHDEAVSLHDKGVRKPHGFDFAAAQKVYSQAMEEYPPNEDMWDWEWADAQRSFALEAVLQWASQGGK